MHHPRHPDRLRRRYRVHFVSVMTVRFGCIGTAALAAPAMIAA